MRNLVSVVIPSYNHAPYIKEAIESVLNQTYQPIELIVIDDGSKDDSVEVIKTIIDDRMQLIQQTNRGAHLTINKGLELAKGDYLSILNSDDIYCPDRIASMMKVFSESPDIDLISSYIEVIDKHGKEIAVKKGWLNLEPWSLPNNTVNFKATNDFMLNLLTSNFISTTSNILFKKSLYQRIGGMRNLRFAHDWDFFLRACIAGKCAQIEKPLIKYRVHDSNTIHTHRAWMLFEINLIMAIYLTKLSDKVFSNVNNTMLMQENLAQLLGSINTQGNDKILWVLMMLLEAAKKQQVDNYEELLLDNAELRESFLKNMTVLC